METVLVVDDLAENRYMLEVLLKGLGYAVVTAVNGREALALALASPPDLVISDILMPEMDGYDLCRRWKSEAKLRERPFIFYTATYVDPRDQEFGLSLGADRFIIKPLRPEVLAGIVREVLDAGPGRARPPSQPDERKALSDYNEVLFRKLEKKVEELESASRRLRAKNQELSDYLYITSHDLRAPLVTIQGFSAFIAGHLAEISKLARPADGGEERFRELLDRKIPEALGFITSGSARIGSILGVLLRVSRIGAIELVRGRVDMAALLAGVTGGLKLRLDALGGEVECGGLPPCFGDADQLRHVVENLLDNALKYRDPGRAPRIVVAGRRESGRCVYTVTDNGRGLTAEEAQGNVWKLFYRGGENNSVPGEGVGLTICKRIIEKHGGTIAAAAAPGGGSVFTFELPAGGVDPAVPD